MHTPSPLAGLALAVATGMASPLASQSAPPMGEMDGADLYAAACANCHGVDGSGAAPSFLAFEEVMPDFTDCSFASREPDADWVGVAHDGGPARGFSPMMPAFGSLLTPEQLTRAMAYVRTFCGDSSWPRGELNLPRAMFTEKAYPEDEWVYTVDTSLEGDAKSVMNEVIYEKRFGSRSMFEVVVPFGARQKGADESPSGDWITGLGDVGVGVKHTLFHSLDAGAILSLGAEAKLPTGKNESGFGGGSTVLEGYVAGGLILPGDAFVQAQGVFESPTAEGRDDEAVVRGVFGRTFTQGEWGRAWTPMLEVQGKRELASGETWGWDLVPQIQVTLNTRQHVMLDFAVLLPITDAEVRETRLFVYLLWDWFDGGFFEGW